MLAIVNCSQVVTLRGPARPRTGPEMADIGVLSNGVILVDGERVAAVGGANEIAIPGGCTVVDAGKRIAAPGFVDAHTHPVFAGSRACEFEMRIAGARYEEIAARGGGIRSTVRKTRAATEGHLFQAARRHADWFLRSGTTTIEAKSGYGLTVEDELKILRVIRKLNTEGVIRTVPTFLGAHDVPDEYRGRAREYTELVIREMLPRVAAEHLAEYCDIFCEPGVFGVVESRQILQAARSLGLGIRMHVDQLSDSNGAALAAELGAVTADHLECTDSAGLAALREAGVQPVLLPGAVYALCSVAYPDARAMIEGGLAVVLATDFNPGSSPTPSMPMILSLAATQMRVTPSESITAATINAAYSLGRGDQIGSLEPGKLADIVIHDCSDYRDLAYFFGIEPAWQVYLSGKLVFSRRAGSVAAPNP
jgi:imidazolonepropionase